MLVASDVITDKDWQAADKGKGDAFIIAGATLYGFSAYCAIIHTYSRGPDMNL